MILEFKLICCSLETPLHNKPHGKGITIGMAGDINIAYWNNDGYAPGNYIQIYNWGDVYVGEGYMKDGRMHGRGTRYHPDGTTEKYG